MISPPRLTLKNSLSFNFFRVYQKKGYHERRAIWRLRGTAAAMYYPNPMLREMGGVDVHVPYRYHAELIVNWFMRDVEGNQQWNFQPFNPPSANSSPSQFSVRRYHMLPMLTGTRFIKRCVPSQYKVWWWEFFRNFQFRRIYGSNGAVIAFRW